MVESLLKTIIRNTRYCFSCPISNGMEPKKVIIHVIFTSTLIYLLTLQNVVPGIRVGGVYSAFVVASLMGLLSIAARTILVTLHVPVRLVTLWIFTVLLNTIILRFIDQFMDHDQFSVDGWLAAFLAALIISGAQAIMHKVTG